MFVNSANLVQISSLDKSLMVVGRVGTGKTRELKKMALSLSKVLVLDPFKEYEELEKQTEGHVTLQYLDCESNKEYRDFKITDDVINVAKQFEYVIVDETNYLCQENFIYFLQQMKGSDIKVIASFQQMPSDAQITKKFGYIISLDVTNDFDKITEYEKYNYDSGFGLKK
ncbi:hypothetical protein SAMN04487922_1624 [Bacillus toyonensis]|uniref:hypothetical protein n=1 Tax=Bacillus cereus group TaxID=86661 RepID=UPI00032F5F50|nr:MULTISPECIES: hypothetical protein [Bacillus cereus group]EOP31669.1 hypothetical protein IG5_04879 [Bacillus toyonensis]PED94356.1 hypothetical protein CON78_30280 [Bacillus toyonensis]PEE20108.1 hypothetical protein CON95_30670 [Bacillus toyonensis]PFX79096.1 hypothetical protein COL40_30570 [Bacillus toyonensis]PHC06503.1 hypothetical protein COE97_29255 [Bacillus toyonensis]